jgi:hypothetical protein
VGACFPTTRASAPEIKRTADSVRLSEHLALDYWEVDPAWDGQVFRSAVQSQRPIGSDRLARELRIKTGRNTCVRLVTVEGEMLQQELHV